MIKHIALIALSMSVTACDNTERVKPLSVEQNQRIIMQVGVNGYKQLHLVKCYDAVVMRINTGKWVDSYCSQTYGHLNYV